MRQLVRVPLAFASHALSILVTAVTVAACSGPPSAAETGKPGTSAAIANKACAGPGSGRLDHQRLRQADRDHLRVGRAGTKVVFDFDSTTQARDVGEAMLAQVQQTSLIDPQTLSSSMFPRSHVQTAKQMTISKGIYDYYEALLDSGGEADPFREYSSLPMPASVFNGRTVADFVSQTAAAYDGGAGLADLTSGSQSKILAAGRCSSTRRWPTSTGTCAVTAMTCGSSPPGSVWAVRWMVANALNPAIVAKYGQDAALPLDHVVAVTTLMKDRSTGEAGVGYQLTHPDTGCGVHQSRPGSAVQLEILGLPDGLTSWRGWQDRCHRQHHQPRRTVPGRRGLDRRCRDARPCAQPAGGQPHE